MVATAQVDNTIDLFGTYAQLWAATEIAIVHSFSPTTTPDSKDAFFVSCVTTPLLFLALCLPTKATLGCAMAMRVTMRTLYAPIIHDAALWAVQTDLVVLAVMTLKSRRSVVPTSAWAIIAQLAIGHLSSAFWKLTSAHFSVRTSCAPIWALSVASSLPGGETLMPPLLIRALATASPLLLVGSEAASDQTWAPTREHSTASRPPLLSFTRVSLLPH